MSDPFIQFSHVVKTYTSEELIVRALDGMGFEINHGELVVIVGPSGSGKTTLLNLLGGMDSPTSGAILVDGQAVHGMTAKQLTEYRRKDIGFVFQFYNLMPNLTALENVELAVEICENPLEPRDVIESVGLRGREGSFPAQLSGGEQQRVSIARAVAKNARIVLCDEPTGALDYDTGKKILALLRDVSRTSGNTVIIVTHNGALRAMADKVIAVKNGRAVEIMENPNPVPIEDIEW
ncbi:MAG: ABC transporter ATP-binding protein [Cellulomonadaceae bacterium]|jgi:putative ABC transport system ATP-binding protein|nr:ABC transporter ATP-binding protein [Cellulomonadaceae bacterium]